MSSNLKRDAAAAALRELQPGMRIGLGTGSTAREFVALLGELVRDGFQCICVPTSEVTGQQARELGIPLATLEEVPELDLTVDGADEVGPRLALIKGAGGALLREKIVAAASLRMVVIADRNKVVSELGAFPLSIEVNRFGLRATELALADVLRRHRAVGGLKLRLKVDGEPFVTDGGHLIVDASFGRISNPEALSADLHEVPGVVEHGLFLNRCQAAYIAGPDGIEIIGRDGTTSLNGE